MALIEDTTTLLQRIETALNGHQGITHITRHEVGELQQLRTTIREFHQELNGLGMHTEHVHLDATIAEPARVHLNGFYANAQPILRKVEGTTSSSSSSTPIPPPFTTTTTTTQSRSQSLGSSLQRSTVPPLLPPGPVPQEVLQKALAMNRRQSEPAIKRSPVIPGLKLDKLSTSGEVTSSPMSPRTRSRIKFEEEHAGDLRQVKEEAEREANKLERQQVMAQIASKKALSSIEKRTSPSEQKSFVGWSSNFPPEQTTNKQIVILFSGLKKKRGY